MTFHVYVGRRVSRVIYEDLDDARAHAQNAIDECRKQATVYEWPDLVSEIAVYEAPDDCGEPWRDGTLVLEARERVVEDEDHPLGQYSEFDIVDVRPWKVNVDESYVGALSPTGGPGGTPELEGAIPLAETVEVWSSDPGLNGTAMVVSTTPEPDSFERIVADCLPDDDDEGEEPGEMCRRALAKAKENVDLIRQVAIKMSGSDDRADFERSYSLEQKTALLGTAREIIELVRGPSVEGPLPTEGAPRVLGGDLVEAAIRYAREGGAGFDTEEAWEQVSFEERDRDDDLTALHDALNQLTMQLVDEYGPDLSGIDEGMVEVPVRALRGILQRIGS